MLSCNRWREEGCCVVIRRVVAARDLIVGFWGVERGEEGVDTLLSVRALGIVSARYFGEGRGMTATGNWTLTSFSNFPSSSFQKHQLRKLEQNDRDLQVIPRRLIILDLFSSERSGPVDVLRYIDFCSDFGCSSAILISCASRATAYAW